jgi:two-component system OmpR family response regulator
MRILLIEDDDRTVAYVTRGFDESGHQCETLADGQDALYQATHDSYDVLIVDRMLPGLDGLALVRALRATGTMTPVLFLTAMSGVDDVSKGWMLAATIT